jgi:hypothetical protein
MLTINQNQYPLLTFTAHQSEEFFTICYLKTFVVDTKVLFEIMRILVQYIMLSVINQQSSYSSDITDHQIHLELCIHSNIP